MIIAEPDNNSCSGEFDTSDRVVYVACGSVQLILMFALIFYTQRNKRMAQQGSETASHILVLPVYDLVLYYVIIIECLEGLDFVIGLSVNNIIWQCIKWALYRSAVEGLAIFFLHHSVGLRAILQSAVTGIVWALITAGLYAFSDSQHVQLQLLVVYECMLLIFYSGLWLLPMSTLQRRPAVIMFARFYSIMSLAILTASAVRWDLDSQPTYCASIILSIIEDVLQPFVIFRALQEDSHYWQGLYSKPGLLLNEPLIGMWEVGRETIFALTASLEQLEYSNPVPIIHFGMLAVDTSTFFPGGSARVYKGVLKNRKVAIKILFCIELTPQAIIAFCQEATILNSLRHPHVVSCEGVCILPPAISLVTEFCENGSLFSLLHKQDVLHVSRIRAQALKLANKIAQSRAAANHSAFFSAAGALQSQDFQIVTSELDAGTYFEENMAPVMSAAKFVRRWFWLALSQTFCCERPRSTRWESIIHSSVFDGSIHPPASQRNSACERSSSVHCSDRSAYTGHSLDDETETLSAIPPVGGRSRSASAHIIVQTPIKTTFQRLSIPSFLESGRGIGLKSLNSFQDVKIGDPWNTSWVADLPFVVRHRMMLHCARGLQFLHSKNLVHCDIKSLNFLVTQDLVVKLADLGEVRPTNFVRTSEMGRMPVSRSWAAPEVLQDRRLDVGQGSDIWSLGMVFYEILTGEVPFETPEAQAMHHDDFVHAIAQGSMRPLLPLATPEWLLALISCMWLFEPCVRPSADDVLKELNAHYREEYPEGTPTSD